MLHHEMRQKALPANCHLPSGLGAMGGPYAGWNPPICRRTGRLAHFFIPPLAYGAEISFRNINTLKGRQGDGLLIATNEPKELRLAGQWGIPTVNQATGLQQLNGIHRQGPHSSPKKSRDVQNEHRGMAIYMHVCARPAD